MIGYGSISSVPVGILQSEIGYTNIVKRRDSILSFFRILITIVELGVAFTGAGALIEGAVGIGAGLANEMIDISEGNQSVKNTLLNFLPTIGSTGAGVLKNFRGVYRYGESVFNAVETAGGATNLGRGLEKAGIQLGQGSSTLNAFTREITGLTRTNVLNRGLAAVNKEQTFSRLSSLIDAAPRTLQKYTPEIYRTTLSKIGGKVLKSGDDVIREINEDVEDFANVVGLTTIQRSKLIKLLVRGRTFEEQVVSYISDAEQLELLDFFRKLDSAGNPRLMKFQEQLEAGIAAIEKFDEMPKGLIANTRYSVLLSTIQGMQKDGALFSKSFISQSKAARAEAIAMADKSLKNRIKKVLMNPGSADFNDFVVQPTQALFDPNDLGRAPIEFLYRNMKNYLSNVFKPIKKIAKNVEKVEDAFVKTGGVLTNSSWIMGYKVIDTPLELPGGQIMIMISFRPEATNNKKPVIVRATRRQILKFIESPGHTYHRYWALAKNGPGGKKMDGLSIFQGAGVLNTLKVFNNSPIMAVLPSHSFSFLNINALRNVLSLVSNVVENTASMVKGDYTKTYWSKLSASFTRNAISRSFRLLAKGVAGPLASRYFGRTIGRFIGAETQRIGTQILAKGIANVRAGKSFGTGLTRAAELGALTSVRSNLRRAVRTTNSNSVILGSLSARRKMYQFARIPNAVVPGRPFKGLKY